MGTATRPWPLRVRSSRRRRSFATSPEFTEVSFFCMLSLRAPVGRPACLDGNGLVTARLLSYSRIRILLVTEMWANPTCGQVLNILYSTGAVSYLNFLYSCLHKRVCKHVQTKKSSSAAQNLLVISHSILARLTQFLLPTHPLTHPEVPKEEMKSYGVVLHIPKVQGTEVSL